MFVLHNFISQVVYLVCNLIVLSCGGLTPILDKYSLHYNNISYNFLLLKRGLSIDNLSQNGSFRKVNKA